MRVICAPDKFKQCCTAAEAAKALATGMLSVNPDAEVIELPIADGGEGTLDALKDAFPERKSVKVQDALGREVDAEFALNDEQALIESAQACGLWRLAEPDRNPAVTHTYGVGQLISAALNAGATEVFVGLGGSATSDGGAGMARALGAKFLDDNGNELEPTGDTLMKVRKLDLSALDPRLQDVKVRALCDVLAPMLGEHGASRQFVVQKGGTTRTMHKLEEGLAMLQLACANAGLKGDGLEPATGAAGGLGFGLYSFCNAELLHGAHEVLKLNGFEKLLAGTTVVLTGEGSFDEQTANGKLIDVLGEYCKQAGVPLIVLAGSAENVDIPGVTAALSISTFGERRQDALNAGVANLERHAAYVARLMAAGKG